MAPCEADPLEWLSRARADLRVAVVTLGVADLPRWAAGFHLQQAAEKALKAVLVAHGRTAPRTHDIGLLADLVAEVAQPLRAWDEEHGKWPRPSGTLASWASQPSSEPATSTS